MAHREGGICMAELLQSDRLDGPDGTRVQVLFYDNKSIRFRIYKKPLVIEEAFLTGNQQGHTIIKVAPPRETMDAEAASEGAARSPRTHDRPT
jgi:hypothetical protein